jgi:lactate racemase
VGQVRQVVESSLERLDLEGKRLLLIVPDSTRTAPVGQMFRLIHEAVSKRAQTLDVMIALGTHPPMSEEAMRRRLEITEEERRGQYGAVGFFNHAWQDSSALAHIGRLTAKEVAELSGGLFSMEIDVTINRAALEYDHLLIVGPVFPHEVVGFSGGSKYLFPGISGPELLNFFHWLGAVITSPAIIGHKYTPIRAVIEKAAAMVPTPCSAFCLVVHEGVLEGLYFGKPPEAWSQAADLSSQLHIVRMPKPFKTVLSCAPAMYDEMWVGGKCAYKLECVVADGGELIVYGPHITRLSATHGAGIEKIGYHVRDYFLAKWDRFKDEPWGVLAHSTHVRGIGTFENGIERPRIQVTLATGIPEEVCLRVNLGYLDPTSISVEDIQGRENTLVVLDAGETLYVLENPPGWAR